VPSDFGFAMAMHPRHPEWLYILPVDRMSSVARLKAGLRVYRTRNAGDSWDRLARGLPQKGAYETVLRDAMTTDSLDPMGFISARETECSTAQPTKGRAGRRFWKACRQWYALKTVQIGRTARAQEKAVIGPGETAKAKTKVPRNSAKRRKKR